MPKKHTKQQLARAAEMVPLLKTGLYEQEKAEALRQRLKSLDVADMSEGGEELSLIRHALCIDLGRTLKPNERKRLVYILCGKMENSGRLAARVAERAKAKCAPGFQGDHAAALTTGDDGSRDYGLVRKTRTRRVYRSANA